MISFRNCSLTLVILRLGEALSPSTLHMYKYVNPQYALYILSHKTIMLLQYNQAYTHSLVNIQAVYRQHLHLFGPSGHRILYPTVHSRRSPRAPHDLFVHQPAEVHGFCTTYVYSNYDEFIH